MLIFKSVTVLPLSGSPWSLNSHIPTTQLCLSSCITQIFHLWLSDRSNQRSLNTLTCFNCRHPPVCCQKSHRMLSICYRLGRSGGTRGANATLLKHCMPGVESLCGNPSFDSSGQWCSFPLFLTDVISFFNICSKLCMCLYFLWCDSQKSDTQEICYNQYLGWQFVHLNEHINSFKAFSF